MSSGLEVMAASGLLPAAARRVYWVHDRDHGFGFSDTGQVPEGAVAVSWEMWAEGLRAAGGDPDPYREG